MPQLILRVSSASESFLGCAESTCTLAKIQMYTVDDTLIRVANVKFMLLRLRG